MATQPPPSAKGKQDEPPPRPVGHEQLEGELDRPILRFRLGAEIDHLHRQEAWRSGTGPSSTTLVKHPDLRVVLVAMRKGETMPVHRTVARITLQVLAGTLRMKIGGELTTLVTGELLVLDHDLSHDVESPDTDSAFLLTLAWPPKGYGEER